MIPLRWRLTLWHLGLTALGLLGLILISYQVLSDSLRAEIDRTLAERANHVADAVAVVPNRPIEGISQEATDEFRTPGVYVQIFDATGAVVAHSFNLGAQQLPITPDEVGRALGGETFLLTSQIEDQPVRLLHRPIGRARAIVGVVQVGQSLAALESTLGRLRWIYAIGVVSILLFGLIGGWALARLGLRPIANVTRAAREVVRAEDLSRRVAYSGPADEVGALATTFNEMLNRLQTLFESQRRFLAEAAHELRTPLASMLGNVDLLVRFGDDTGRRQEVIIALQRTGRHVGRLLDDLLLAAQAEAGWHLQLRPVAIDDIFLEAYEALRPTMNNVALSLQACEPAQVLGDPDRLRQVFVNLIDNAIKFSPPSGIVTLALTRHGDRVRVQIGDVGSGIPPEALPHVFDPFFRDPRGQRLPGAGLGLSITQWIVHEHGGEMSIQSTPGCGTTVSFSLPECTT